MLFRDCDYPQGFMVWIGLHGVMFLFLFSDFYKTRYRKVQAKKNGYKSIPSTNGVSHNKGACMVSFKRYLKLKKIFILKYYFYFYSKQQI